MQRILQRDCMSPELTDTESEHHGGQKRLITASVPWRSSEVETPKNKLIYHVYYLTDYLSTCDSIFV